MQPGQVHAVEVRLLPEGSLAQKLRVECDIAERGNMDAAQLLRGKDERLRASLLSSCTLSVTPLHAATGTPPSSCVAGLAQDFGFVTSCLRRCGHPQAPYGFAALQQRLARPSQVASRAFPAGTCTQVHHSPAQSPRLQL